MEMAAMQALQACCIISSRVPGPRRRNPRESPLLQGSSAGPRQNAICLSAQLEEGMGAGGGSRARPTLAQVPASWHGTHLAAAMAAPFSVPCRLTENLTHCSAPFSVLALDSERGARRRPPPRSRRIRPSPFGRRAAARLPLGTPVALLRPILKNPETGQVRLDESGIPTARLPIVTTTTKPLAQPSPGPQQTNRARPPRGKDSALCHHERVNYRRRPSSEARRAGGEEGPPRRHPTLATAGRPPPPKTSASISHARTPHTSTALFEGDRAPFVLARPVGSVAFLDWTGLAWFDGVVGWST